jgi:hypothetical protein
MQNYYILNKIGVISCTRSCKTRFVRLHRAGVLPNSCCLSFMKCSNTSHLTYVLAKDSKGIERDLACVL